MSTTVGIGHNRLHAAILLTMVDHRWRSSNPSTAGEFSLNGLIVTDLVYRMDMVAHRSGLKRGLGINALFGDMHVQFQHDQTLFDTTSIWNGTENGQSPNGGIEDEGANFRWFLASLKP